MNEIIDKEDKYNIDNLETKIKIEDMIYDINGKQVMLDSEISATK